MKIGLIGCGNWGALILRDLIACGVEVHVACRSEQTAAKARKAGATEAHTALDDLPAMDGYVVATPTISHADVLDRLVATGRPIFVEKPMTADLASAERLARQAADRLFVMDKWRYHPVIEAMRQEIADGGIGDVQAIRTERWQWGNPHDDVDALWILAPHDFAIVLHLTGDVPPVTDAHAAVPSRPELGTFIALGAADAPTVMVNLGVTGLTHERRCVVIGTAGCLQLSGGYESEMLVRRGAPGDRDATEERVSTGNEMPLLAELRGFIDFVAGIGPPPLSGAEQGALIVRRLDEADRFLRAQRAGPP